MLQAPATEEYLGITVDGHKTDGAETPIGELSGLFDVARWLTRDDRAAERMVDLIIQEVVRHTGGYRTEDREPLRLLVRVYLRRRSFAPSALARLKKKFVIGVSEQRQGASILEQGIYELHAEERACLILREKLGLSTGEIVEITGLDLERVQQSLFSAREWLRARASGELQPENWRC